MPKYNVIGNVFYVSGFDQTVEAATEEQAREIVHKQVEAIAETWTTNPRTQIAGTISVQEVCIQEVMLVEELSPSQPSHERAALAGLIAGMIANDDAINDKAHGGDNARSPEGDDYNVLFDLVLDAAREAGVPIPDRSDA